MNVLLAFGIIFGALALFAIVFLVVAPPPRRVAIERRIAPGEEHVSALSKATDRAVATIESVSGRREHRLFGEERLELAGIKSEPSAFLIVVIAVSAVLGLLGVVIGFGSFWSVILGALFAALGPLLVSLFLSSRTESRRSKFGDQLDDTLQLVSGNLRAGHGLMQSIDSVAQHADPPTSEEFARIVNETRIGRDLGDALSGTADRMKSDDFTWAAQAIQINRETGGNLSETLQRTAATIRERNQIRRQVKALSAEGRLSATILILLPIVVVLGVIVLRPEYLAPFVETPIGWAAMFVAILLMIIGIVWMIAAVRVKF
ncbi:type II secretion system F family protein [Agromyces endophyticus]|uniref:type II secretion system F family protein n=1 Tax=Agromyces sp. H17E-10 TaxID=2932244 RepID=UPI001FD0F697|nr:type II secretion system F family protein [Agromyces sp. H17E-10]UOQ90591.1 type II secretion system F family protein [Agromyces sp. H17E-10]